MTPEDEIGGDAQRQLAGPWLWGATGLAVALSVFHLAAALTPLVSDIERNVIHFGGFALLCALWTPASRRMRGRGWLWVDLALGLAVAAAALYVARAESAIYARGVRLSTLDWVAGCVVLVGALEFARRAAGPVIPVLMILALGYVAWWGRFVGGVFNFPGLSPETVLFRSLYGDDAMFGSIARISAATVFPFIIFGAFLLRSGAGDFVIALARAVAGRMIGGPGLVAVIASGLTGTISGSAVANTASTGVITIPLMKRAGFPPKFAGAVEAAASTGGQVMPPIMGAGAFVMASYTRIPYDRIVAVAALPALLYFLSVAFFVRIEAKRQGLGAMPGVAVSLWDAMKAGGAAFFLPIGAVIWALLSGYTPSYAAVIGIGATVAASWLGARRMGPRAVVEALALGARNMIMTAVLLVAVGVVVNVISTAGVGNVFSLMIAQWAGGNVLVAIALIAVASLVLGMGLPVTAAYIVLATLSAPALAGMISDATLVTMLATGTLPQTAAPILMLASPEAAAAAMAGPIPTAEARALIGSLPIEALRPLRDAAIARETAMAALLSAHMIIFWLSQDSNVTPPVCLAAFTAAAIARAPAMATGFTSWKLAKGLYIVPLLFAFTPILSGDWAEALRITAFAAVGVYGLAASMEGWMESRLAWPLRVAAGAAGAAALWPAAPVANGAGAAGVLAMLALSIALAKRARAPV
ncbi:MAG: TRAP transporter fused permease subunit [Rhodobacteraceae bacterium]|nr:MAG: TRAP transporter fused permease subunit [Paracoccaceae bacterium]